MSDAAKKYGDGETQEGKRSFLEGIVTSGDLKGKPFIVYLGEAPKKSSLIIDNEVIPCRKIEMIVDSKKPKITIKFDCKLVPKVR